MTRKKPFQLRVPWALMLLKKVLRGGRLYYVYSQRIPKKCWTTYPFCGKFILVHQWGNTKFPGINPIPIDIKENPLIYGIGEDPERDNLPWQAFWNGEDGYISMVTGLLTEVVNFILIMKEQKERIIITHSRSFLQNHREVVLQCKIIPQDEYKSALENVNFDEDLPQIARTAVAEDIFEKISKVISIDKLDELFESPTSTMKLLLTNVLEKALHMEVKEVLDHFTNYEEEYFKVLGWLLVHGINEAGRSLEKLFESEKVSRIYGHIFIFLRNNAARFIPLSVMSGFQDYFGQIYHDMGGVEFAETFRSFEAEQCVDFIFDGIQKALQDLGVPFSELKSSIYEEIEFLKTEPGYETIPKTEKEKNTERKAELMQKLFEQLLLISTTVLSIPVQLSFLFLYNALSAGNEIFVNSFNNIKSANDRLVEILDELNIGKST